MEGPTGSAIASSQVPSVQDFVSCSFCKSDVLGANSKVAYEILAGVLQIMKCPDAKVGTAHRSLPMRFGGL